MRCNRTALKTIVLLLVAIISVRASDDKSQPAPEPYSFSYSAESAGGVSSRQESGDGSGRVSGFYTIQEEDGRERRVDYVADENGYRATVKTNEIGTRTGPTGDAQYFTQPPSQKQLEAAKVTAEQYMHLDSAHLAQRERYRAATNKGAGSRWQLPDASADVSQPGRTLRQVSGQYQEPALSFSGVKTINESKSPRAPQLLSPFRVGRPSPIPQVQVDGLSDVQQNTFQGSSIVQQFDNGIQQQPAWIQASQQQERPLYQGLPTRQPAAPQLSFGGQSSLQVSTTGLNHSNPQHPSEQPTRFDAKNSFVQNQIAQQFLQQATQLTDQDYPRQEYIDDQQVSIDGSLTSGQQIQIQNQQQSLYPRPQQQTVDEVPKSPVDSAAWSQQQSLFQQVPEQQNYQTYTQTSLIGVNQQQEYATETVPGLVRPTGQELDEPISKAPLAQVVTQQSSTGSWSSSVGLGLPLQQRPVEQIQVTSPNSLRPDIPTELNVPIQTGGRVPVVTTRAPEFPIEFGRGPLNPTNFNTTWTQQSLTVEEGPRKVTGTQAPYLITKEGPRSEMSEVQFADKGVRLQANKTDLVSLNENQQRPILVGPPTSNGNWKGTKGGSRLRNNGRSLWRQTNVDEPKKPIWINQEQPRGFGYRTSGGASA